LIIYDAEYISLPRLIKGFSLYITRKPTARRNA
jgi:hypothetical protein